MKPQTEVKASLNVLYDAVFNGSTDQLVVKQASEDSYVIVLRAKAAIECLFLKHEVPSALCFSLCSFAINKTEANEWFSLTNFRLKGC
jgi:hypothetical protein